MAADPGAFASLAILLGIGLIVLGDLVLAADRLSISVNRYSGGLFRARVLVFTGFASFDIALALLLAAGLALAARPSSPAAFRGPTLVGVAAAAAGVAVIAIIRALFVVSFGHAYGFGVFVQALATIPVAAVAAGLAAAGAHRTR